VTETVLADLLPWVIGFFALDGFVQLGRGHLLAAGGGRLRPLRAGLHWLGFSPATEAVALFDLPFLRAGGRLWIVDPKRRSEPTLLEAQDLTPVDLAAAGALDRTHKSVTAGDTLLFNAPTTALAARLMAELAAPPPGRPATRAARADLRAARALRLRLRPYRITLQVLAWILGALLFVAAPLAVWSPLSRYPLASFILRETGVLLLAIAALGGAYLRAGGEPWGRSIGRGLALLLPWEALHPLTHLSRAIYRRFDAPTALAALLPAEEFHAYAARELVRARLSRERTPPELGPAWDEREQLLSRLLTATGSSPARALAPPAAEPDEAAYCPLCRTAYRAGSERCADCDMALVALR
jgi:hypothetical protein